MAEGFMRRWARRKSEAVAQEHRTPVQSEAGERPQGSREQAPSMQEAGLLKPDADFSRFVARNVAPDVRRAALKTLFSDPHFQRMDGLDIYIGDYTQPSPLTPAMLAALSHAKSTLSPRPLYQVEQNEETVPVREASPALEDGEESDAVVSAALPESEDIDPEPDVAVEQASPAEQARLPFNDRVNFSHEREKDWTQPKLS